jgi:hypothetical protein
VSGQLVCAVTAATWDTPDGLVTVQPGTVTFAERVPPGRESLFAPLVIEIALEDDLPLGEAVVAVCGRESPDPAWLRFPRRVMTWTPAAVSDQRPFSMT